ncbi:hypothetical protein AV926_06155 [Myroides marinus]|uniref:Uncharacterized protein n=1 Tax=Myroides marinus TaxID=703342 RepID=A0A161SBH9_9FLAO|nr:hypothetical protein AV926_06155 [Myroides marinus]
MFFLKGRYVIGFFGSLFTKDSVVFITFCDLNVRVFCPTDTVSHSKHRKLEELIAFFWKK